MNSLCGGLTGMSPGTVFNFRMKLADSLGEEAEAMIEIQGRQWAQSMAAFLKDSNGEKKRRVAGGGGPFSSDELAAMDARHIKILDQGDAEYRAAAEGKKNVARFRDGRRLLARLRKRAAERLRFLHDFDVPFANNKAGQGVHCLKGKTRVSGGFRTGKGAKARMLIASVIASARRRGMNVLDTIKDACAGRKIFGSGQPSPACGPPAANPPAS
jgi:transposase